MLNFALRPQLPTTNYFADDGKLQAASNAFGQVFYRQFDLEDRVTNNINVNGVSVTNTYDFVPRLLTRTYPDGGVERYAYATNIVGPVIYSNQLNYATSNTYDAAARLIGVTNALGKVIQYAYDDANDLTNLTDQNNNHTFWLYNQYGNVTNKLLGTNLVFTNGYDADNRLTTRWSAIGATTTYGYDSNANLTLVTYSGGNTTASNANVYDADNRLTSMSDGVGTTTFKYTAIGQLASETGPWASDAVAYTYNARMPASVDLQQPNAADWKVGYSWDSGYRLSVVTSPVGTFQYAYLGGASNSYVTASPLVGKLTLPNNAYISSDYDQNARLAVSTLYNSGNGVVDYTEYTYNSNNWRTAQQRGPGPENQVSYTYDRIGEVLTDTASEASGGYSRLNEQLKYGFDPAGNLLARTNNALIQNFYVNNLNELTSNANSGTLTVLGTTTSHATNVTVNNITASNYLDSTFAAPGMGFSNSYNATAKDTNGRVSTTSITVALSNVVAFVYDANGNLTSDGLRHFSYNDENELVGVGVANAWSNQFVYDGRMRRRITTNLTWSGTAWISTNVTRYVYDGKLVFQERDGYNTPTVAYVRGVDLSASLQEVGGIGGLLARKDLLLQQPAFYYSDGMGNVRTMINWSNAVVARYFYDGFGDTLSKSGSLADANVYRFCGKEADAASGLGYHLYRYYDPNLQRWINRDPIDEVGYQVLSHSFSDSEFESPVDFTVFLPPEPLGQGNLYDYVGNTSINMIDPWGLAPFTDGAATLTLDPTLLMDADELAAYKAAQAAAAAQRAAAAAAAAGTVCESRQHGQGERSRTGNSNAPNKYKHWSTDPNNPNRIVGKDQNGKTVFKPKPPDFPPDK